MSYFRQTALLILSSLTISDAEIERRKLKSRRSSPVAIERLRQIELEVEEASRKLRRAKTQVTRARERFDELQERHWATLSFYNPAKAGEKVSEALEEFHRLEPAARLEDFNPSSAPEDSGKMEADDTAREISSEENASTTENES